MKYALAALIVVLTVLLFAGMYRDAAVIDGLDQLNAKMDVLLQQLDNIMTTRGV
jgi:hypothetical protein